MIHYRTKHIPVSHVSFCNLVLGISLCQRINILVHTKDILRFNACHNVSIMTCVINARRSVTPQVTTFNRTNLYIFHVRTFNIVCLSVFPSPVRLLSYLSCWVNGGEGWIWVSETWNEIFVRGIWGFYSYLWCLIWVAFMGADSCSVFEGKAWVACHIGWYMWAT